MGLDDHMREVIFHPLGYLLAYLPSDGSEAKVLVLACTPTGSLIPVENLGLGRQTCLLCLNFCLSIVAWRLRLIPGGRG